VLKAVASNIAQALQSRGFLIGFLAVICLLFLFSIEGILSAFRSDTLLQNGYHAAFVMDSLSSDAMTLALPIVVALPYTASFVEDVKSGFIKAYLPRTTTNAGWRWHWASSPPTASRRCCSPPWKQRWQRARSPQHTSRSSWEKCCCSSAPGRSGR